MAAGTANIGPVHFGMFIRRIEIQAPFAQTNDQFGEPVVVWVTVAKRWASMRPLAGKELFAARQVQPDATHEMHMRYVPRTTTNPAGISPRMRFIYQGRIFAIESVVDVEERHRQIVCLCHEVPG